MPLVSYIHGGKGYAHLRFCKDIYAASPSYKTVPIAPVRAAISWDEPLIPTELFEGLREVYAWMGGPRLCTWSVQGYLLDSSSTSYASIADVLNGIFSVTQGSSTGYYMKLAGGFALEVFDGAWQAIIPAVASGVSFPGVGVSCMIDYPPGAPVAIRIDGISGVPVEDTYLKKHQDSVSPPIPTNSLNRFINAGKTTVRLNTTVIHALNLTIAANREPQVVYTLSPGLVVADPRFTDATNGDPFIGNQHFLYPLVTSVGRIRATASFVVDNKILARRDMSASGQDTFLENASYDSTDLVASVPYGNNTNLSITLKEVALRGKSNVFTSAPRVPTVIVAIANPRSINNTSTNESVIEAEIA